ncbi:MAG: ABC transporter ATP-binding protein [Candidatus Kryptoniota bacterium]
MKNNKISSSFALQLIGITKRFPGVLANDLVNFDLKYQEIHALLGENGAGKSTLMNISYGLYHPDSGKIMINGQEVVIHSPSDALKCGIGMVHQHFMLVPGMTVTENLMLGHELTSGLQVGLFSKLNREKVAEEIAELSHLYGFNIDPHAFIEDLSVGEAQRVEILKALYKGAQILILDEPTAVLTPQETDELFNIMRSLTQQGKSIIFITHKLKEVMDVADRITVMRLGRVVETTTPDQTNMQELARMMVGRDVLLSVDRGTTKIGSKVLEVENLYVTSHRDTEAVRGVDFSIHAGEIYGIAGVQGNGQTELVEAITGLRKVKQGKIYFAGREITNLTPRTIIQKGLAHVPEDRLKHGLVVDFSVETNLILQTYYEEPFSNGWWIRPKIIAEFATNLVQEFDIRTPSIQTKVEYLSGGNQQKIVMARELSRAIKLLIANQPTRGLDVGSIEFIHQRILNARNQGVAVLLVSAELDEILSLADRIGVMYNGQLVAEIPAAEATRELIGLYMAGLSAPQVK